MKQITWMLQIQKEGNQTPSLIGQSGIDVLEEEELLATVLGFSREIEPIRTYRCVCVWVCVGVCIYRENERDCVLGNLEMCVLAGFQD